MKRALLWPFATALLPLALSGQPDSTAPSSPAGRRQNAWVSGGLGVGTGGIGAIGSVWYSNNYVVVGIRKTYAAPIIGRDVRDTAWMLGLRNLAPRRIILVAAGPARLEGLHHRGDNDPSVVVPSNERGMAISAEGFYTFGAYGVGSDLFAARSKNRSSMGATVSLQVGWFRK